MPHTPQAMKGTSRTEARARGFLDGFACGMIIGTAVGVAAVLLAQAWIYEAF